MVTGMLVPFGVILSSLLLVQFSRHYFSDFIFILTIRHSEIIKVQLTHEINFLYSFDSTNYKDRMNKF